MQPGAYTSLLIFGLFVAGFIVTLILLATFLGPRNRTRTKQLPFECGSVAVGDSREQRFNVRFYLVAVLFILFDLEVAFLYPWALVLPQIGWAGFSAMLSFVCVMGVGLVYVWRKGIFDWNA